MRYLLVGYGGVFVFILINNAEIYHFIMKILGANAEIAQLVVVCDSYSQGRWFEPNSRYNFKWCTTFGIRFVKAL